MASTIPDALKKINWIMRDWRKNEAIEMDPKTIDLLWEMHTELGRNEPIHIICGYRSRDTNDMLRRTVGGQAKKSQHMTGKAIDVTFPDMPAEAAALVGRSSAKRGGVGYYPTSGIPFVHVDTGRVRAWPRLPRNELALLFPERPDEASAGGRRLHHAGRRARSTRPTRMSRRRSPPTSSSATTPSADPSSTRGSVAPPPAPKPPPTPVRLRRPRSRASPPPTPKRSQARRRHSQARRPTPQLVERPSQTPRALRRRSRDASISS